METNYKCLQFVFVLALGLLTACNTSGQTGEPENFGEVDVKRAKEMIETYTDTAQFVLLDTRTPAEYDKGHLNGAFFINYSADDFWENMNRLNKEKTYLVYCHSGGRSGETVEFMKENGFKKAYNLEGGIIAWKRAGYRVVTD